MTSPPLVATPEINVPSINIRLHTWGVRGTMRPEACVDPTAVTRGEARTGLDKERHPRYKRPAPRSAIAFELSRDQIVIPIEVIEKIDCFKRESSGRGKKRTDALGGILRPQEQQVTSGIRRELTCSGNR